MSKILANARQLKPEIRLAQAISQFEANLSAETKAAFRTLRAQTLSSPPDPNDVLRLTAEMDHRMGDRCFGPRFTNFLQSVQQFAALGDTVVGGSQNIIACAVWSVVRVSLLRIVDSSLYEKLSHLFMELGRSAPRYEAMASLYPRSKTLQSQLSEYFIVVVDLCRHIMSSLQTSILQGITTALYNPELKTFQFEIDNWSNLIRDEINQMLSIDADIEAKQNSDFEEMLRQRQFQDQYYSRKITKEIKVLNFCSTYNHEATWKQTRKLGHTTAFAQLEHYQEWRAFPNSSAFVCIGKPGAGKSVLLANIVDDLHKFSHAKGLEATVTYFFCRRDIPESSKAQTILGSLTRQLLRAVPDISMVADICDATDSTYMEKLFELISRVFPPDRRAYFVLDGINECDYSERKALVQGLQKIQSKIKLLIFFSSRDMLGGELDSIAIRCNFWTASMTDNNPEIETYIQRELEHCIATEKLLVGDPNLILEIRDVLLKGSRGNFLLVAHWIRSLCDTRTDKEIRDMLVNPPLHDLVEALATAPREKEDPEWTPQGWDSDSSSNNNSNKSVPQSSVFDEESHRRGAFTSTIPTSQGTSNAKAEGEADSLRDLGSRDSDTIYSTDSLPEDLEYVLLFAHRLTQDLRNESGLPTLSDIPQNFISNAIGAFTWRLYEESKDPFQWETSVILHRRKNKIIGVLVGNELDEERSDVETSEEDSDEKSRLPFVKSHDYLSMWVNDVSTCNDEVPQPPDDLDTGESHLFQIADYERFIHQSDAYRWLLSKISQYGRLHFGPSDVMTKIGERVLNELQAHGSLRTMSRRRPLCLVKMTFDLGYNPKDCISCLGIHSSSSDILDKVLCLTGTWSEAQAMTVSEYICQTWPVSGDSIKLILQELIAKPDGQECVCTLPGTKGANISARVTSNDSCIISVIAGTYFVSEFAEQMAWLAATLRTSPRNGGVIVCRPHIKALSVRNTPPEDPTITANGNCSFSFEYEHEVTRSHSESGFCWGSLFRNPTLVSGFPIRIRPEGRTGLEMTISTMARLIKSDQLVQCGERIMMKGFGSLLIATFITSNVILWHFLKSKVPGERISYFDNQLDILDLSNCNIASLRQLESSRHIVGWCVKATDFCGHMTANCTVSESRLRPSPSSLIIDRMYIEGGMHVIGGINILPNQKEQPIKLQRERDYPELLQMVAAHPVAFYDVEDRRAWLVDGASALLYLVRISLHLDATDPESTYDWVFDDTKIQDTWDGCSGRIAALKTLKSWDHRNLPVYVKGQSTHDGQVIRTFSTFGDRVDKILHWLEILIDRDVHLASQDGIKVSQTLDRRKNISGFDLLDLIKPLGPIGTRVAPFDSWGDGWIDLFPCIGVTTIFGGGFGDLIRPNDPDQVCADWKSVPVGQDYMTASISTLKMIHEKRLRRLTPTLRTGELTSNILWTSPCHPFKSCTCMETELTDKQKHIDPVQFLVSKRSWNPSRKPKDTALVDMQTLNETGAVVFANLSLLGRRIDVKVAHRTTERVDGEAALAVPSDSSQASTLSVAALGLTQSANVTNITTPSEGSVGNGSQTDDIELHTGMSRAERFQRRWDKLRKK